MVLEGSTSRLWPMNSDRRLASLVVEGCSHRDGAGRDSSYSSPNHSEIDTPLASSPPAPDSPDPFSRTASLPEPGAAAREPFRFSATSPTAGEKRGHRRRRRPHFPSIR